MSRGLVCVGSRGILGLVHVLMQRSCGAQLRADEVEERLHLGGNVEVRKVRGVVGRRRVLRSRRGASAALSRYCGASAG